jgi:hypothetical protein
MGEDSVQQRVVKHADAAGLDDDIGPRRLRQRVPNAGFGRGVDDHMAPGRRVDVTMALSVERVGFEECDVVTERRQGPENAAVVGRGAIPVGRQQAGPVHRDLHSAAPRGAAIVVRTVSSSSTRCAQVWRSRIRCRPLATRAWARS